MCRDHCEAVQKDCQQDLINAWHKSYAIDKLYFVYGCHYF